MAQRLEAEGEEVRLLVMIDPMGALASRHYRVGGDGELEGDVPGGSEESAREFWAWKPFESPPWNLYRRYKEWREWYKKKGRSRVRTWFRRKGRVWYKRIRGVKRWAVRMGKEIKLQYRNLLGRWYMRARRPLTQEMRTAVLVIRGREIGATYKHRPYHGRVIYFKARKTHESSADSWLEFLAGETQVVEVPGDHGTLLQGTNLDEVVEVLGPVLKALDRG
jgi:hypothetical protein